jgi:hypothetical protein
MATHISSLSTLGFHAFSRCRRENSDFRHRAAIFKATCALPPLMPGHTAASYAFLGRHSLPKHVSPQTDYGL